MRRTLLGSLLLLAVAPLSADTVTLPAVASIVGAAPFFSDVRVFNTSYTSSLDVTATYRCFIGTCPAAAPQLHITLAPRASRAFDDMVASGDGFNASATAGGVEFDFDGGEDQLVVTSRLYSTSPMPTVGMFIAGLSQSKAQATSVLTSIRNAGPVKGFRTNVGCFNSNDSSASVTFQIFNDGAPVGASQTKAVPAHSGAQLSGIFALASVPTLEADHAVIVVTATMPVFSYAAVIDNNTTDPILVVGAPDQTSQPVPPANRIVHVGRGGTFFVDDQSGTGVTTANVGDTVTWVWEGTLHHGTASGTCSGGGGGYGGDGGGCTHSGTWDSNIQQAPFSYPYTFSQAGTFPYFCDVHLQAMTGRVIVNAPAASASMKRKTAAR